MKKLILIAALYIVAYTTANAQVPDSIKRIFEQKYSGTDANWKADGNGYSVYFSDSKNQQHVAGYDKQGQLIYHRVMINSETAPLGISNYYQSNIPGQKEYNVWMEEDVAGTPSYYTINGNERLYFDHNGNYIRSVTIDPDDPLLKSHDGHRRNPSPKK